MTLYSTLSVIPVLILVTQHGQDGLLQLEIVVPHMFLVNHEDPDQQGALVSAL